tara:strand:+ start:1186 stop:2295 length:1110 start_codon:yes stop_codon:yes gene_type:complete
MIDKVLIFENSYKDYFESRKPFINFLKKNKINAYGFIPIPEKNEYFKLEIDKVFYYRKKNLFMSFFYQIYLLRNIFLKNKINCIHSFRFFPNIINSISNLFNNNKVICHITGLGVAFSNNDFFYRFLKILSIFFYQIILYRSNIVITQNDDDFDKIDIFNLFKRKNKIIYSSGVDCSKYKPTTKKNNNNPIRFLFVSRLLIDKGLVDLVNAFDNARRIKKNIVLDIVGGYIENNKRYVSKAFIEKWNSKNYINFCGEVNDVSKYYKNSDIFILPSMYGEGIPRVLIEAAASGLPIITTNISGCRQVVVNNCNGFLLENTTIPELVNILVKLSNKKNLGNFGNESRKIALRKFSNKVIFNQFLDCYKMLI